MASPFEELNAFNLAQLARSGQPLERLGEARVGLAQYQLERQAQQQDEERRRQGRVADALTIFDKELAARAKLEDEAFRKSIEREASVFGVETKGKDTAALLRATHQAKQAEIDKLDRKKVIQRLNALGAGIDPNDMSTPEENLRGLLGEAEEERSLALMVDQTKAQVRARDEAQRALIEENLPTIKQTLESIEAEHEQDARRLDALIKQPIVADDTRVRQRFLASEEGQTAMIGLKEAQLKLLREGDLRNAIAQIAKKDERKAADILGALAKARQAEESYLFDQKEKEVEVEKIQIRQRKFSKQQALAGKYGPDIFGIISPRPVAPPAPPPEGVFRLPPAGTAAPIAAPRPSALTRAFNAPGGFAPPLPTTGFTLPRVQSPAVEPIQRAPTFLNPFAVQGFVPPFYTPPTEPGVFVGPQQ